MMKTFFALSFLSVFSGVAAEKPVTRLAFVSCYKESKKASALKTIAEWKPDVFVWMGDNIYGDSENMSVLREKYQQVSKNTNYLKIKEEAVVLGTWDDHDYGANDVGKEFAFKAESQEEFLDFFEVGKKNPRREREGVYHFEDLGPEGQQVRVILLDTRYHRDELGSDGTILGRKQWQWLETTLRGSEAEVNILVSSIQVLPTEHRFEKWSNFPKERARLLELLGEEGVPPVLLLSGDRHLAEISLDRENASYPLYEITSSSLNHSFGGSPDEVNCLRVGENFGKNNFGTLVFDWSGDFPGISAAICDENGEIQLKLPILVSK